MKSIHFVIFLSLAVLAGCGGKSVPPPILVGLVGDLHGVDASARNGILLALDDLNKEAERKIVVRQADTQGKLDAYETQAVRLVAFSRVAALFGGDTPDEVLRLDHGRIPSDAEASAFLPVISTTGWRTSAMSAQVVLTGMSPSAQGKALARFAAEELKAPSVIVLVQEGNAARQALAEAFVREFREAVGKEAKPAAVQSIAYGGDVKLPEVLERIQQQKPAAILVAGPKNDLRAVTEKIHFKTEFLYGGEDGSLRADDWLKADTIYLASAFGAEKGNQAVQEFVESYRKSFQQTPDVAAALCFESMKMLGQALRGAADSASQFKEELFKIKEFPGLLGPLSFDAERRLQRPVVVLRRHAQEFTVVRKFGP